MLGELIVFAVMTLDVLITSVVIMLGVKGMKSFSTLLHYTVDELQDHILRIHKSCLLVAIGVFCASSAVTVEDTFVWLLFIVTGGIVLFCREPYVGKTKCTDHLLFFSTFLVICPNIGYLFIMLTTRLIYILMVTGSPPLGHPLLVECMNVLKDQTSDKKTKRRSL